MSIDLLMKFVKGSDAIDAESQTSIDSSDGFLHDFKAGKFFEIDEFSFGVGLQDENPAGEKRAMGVSVPDRAPRPSHSRFNAWLGGSAMTYRADLEPFSFTRQMDQASPLLFEMCGESQSFSSVTLVKRKAASTGVSGHAFLRIDFTDVLVIDVDWDSGDVVKEKCKFICREVKVQYKPQKSDGSLGAPVPGTWKYKMGHKG